MNPLALVALVAALAFADPEGRYEVLLPEGWAVAADPAVPRRYTAVPPGARGPERIQVLTGDLAGKALDDHLDRVIAGSRGTWQVRERARIMLPAGPAIRLVVDQARGADRLRLFMVFFVAGGRFYMVAGQADPYAFAAARPRFEAVARSFRLRGVAPAASPTPPAPPSLAPVAPASVPLPPPR